MSKANSRRINAFRRAARAYLAERGVRFDNAPSNQVLIDLCTRMLGVDRLGARATDIDRLIKVLPKPERASKQAKTERVVRRRAHVDFYNSPDWRRVRYQVLLRSAGKCECCGAGKAAGAVLHVDHIKPRSRHPHLELEPSNLQVLCADCNLGKGAADETDWRIRPG